MTIVDTTGKVHLFVIPQITADVILDNDGEYHGEVSTSKDPAIRQTPYHRDNAKAEADTIKLIHKTVDKYIRET
jgi:hypothetical protein